MANIITCTRILISAALFFCPALSPIFYSLYLSAGISDMIDGAVARETNTVSAFGSRLDTIADFVFVTVCLIKLFPVMNIPGWVYLWIAGIAVIKLFNIALGYIKEKKLIAVHSFMNKATGVLLLILPLTFSFISLENSAIAVCTVATVAAIQEGHYINSGCITYSNKRKC